jgi:hypothetical protein
MRITSLSNSKRFNEISNIRCFYNITTELMRNETEIPDVYSYYDILVYDTMQSVGGYQGSGGIYIFLQSRIGYRSR